jgi:hypothetical protein
MDYFFGVNNRQAHFFMSFVSSPFLPNGTSKLERAAMDMTLSSLVDVTG